MHETFEHSLTHAVSLLRDLPRGRQDVADARTRLERFREGRPGVQVTLLIDQPPGSPWVDYDLLLGHPEGGTVALSYRADDGLPWSVEYADHWAANYVVTVNDRHVTVQQGLLFLKLAGHHDPDLMAEIVDDVLIEQAIAEDPPPVSEEELQAAADAFRLTHGLYSAEATHRWLAEMGVSEEQFGEIQGWEVQARKLEERVTEDRVESYFEAHRESFDVVQLLRVTAPTETTAELLAEAAKGQDLLSAVQACTLSGRGKGLEGALRSHRARELPPGLATAPTGAVEGSVAGESRHWVAQVLGRQPAQLDDDTRAEIRKILFQEWLAERREQATVRWHWM
jgi:putative peptide maturation system protein